MQGQIAPAVIEGTQKLRQQFGRRDPFRHVVIDDFLDAAFAARLLAEFPAFDRGNALNEAGEVGNKSVVERIRDIAPSYRALDDLVKSQPFLDLVAEITGIPGLLYDPWYFGGGTHENRHGQDLDPHIDFNRHPIERWHRRLNLIVYLNPRWEASWGGNLALHSDPRSEADRRVEVTPLFNRCVIFETTEWSWHGFSRIDLPSGLRDLTRRSIALYFYSHERPQEERADTHSTVYVDRALPERFAPGLTLAPEDVEELKVLLRRRDMHNQRLYRDLQALQKQLEEARELVETGRLGRAIHLARRLRRLFR